MSSPNLIRLGGLAAIIAGILRGINSFLPANLPSVTICILQRYANEILYSNCQGG